MKDRIEINGVWYVKEELKIPTGEPTYDIVNSLECLYESKDFCFEATVLLKDEAETVNEYSSFVSIEVTDKRKPKEKRETYDIDNPQWVLDTLKDNTEATLDFNNVFNSPQGLKEYREFIEIIKEKGWLDE